MKWLTLLRNKSFFPSSYLPFGTDVHPIRSSRWLRRNYFASLPPPPQCALVPSVPEFWFIFVFSSQRLLVGCRDFPTSDIKMQLTIRGLSTEYVLPGSHQMYMVRSVCDGKRGDTKRLGGANTTDLGYRRGHRNLNRGWLCTKAQSHSKAQHQCDSRRGFQRPMNVLVWPEGATSSSLDYSHLPTWARSSILPSFHCP